MRARNPRVEFDREFLSRAIIDVLNSWPEQYRRIFIRARYGGRSTDQIADVMRLEPVEVNRILRWCERDLYEALREFRAGAFEEKGEVCAAGGPAWTLHGCCH